MKLSSFWCAIKGIFGAMKTEKNYRVMLGCAVAVIVLNIVLSVSAIHWVITLMCCGAALSLELLNSAVEKTVDLFTKNYSPLAEKAKDFAAGAVLIISCFAAAAALIIYIPYFM